MVAFNPGRTTVIEDGRTFIDGEEVSAPEGTGGAGDVFIGGTANSGGEEASESENFDEGLLGTEEANGTSVFRNINQVTPDVVADGGEVVEANSEDNFIGSNAGAGDISGVGTDTVVPDLIANSNNGNSVSSEIQSRKANVLDLQLSGESCTSDCFVDDFDADFDATLNFDMESDDVFL